MKEKELTVTLHCQYLSSLPYSSEKRDNKKNTETSQAGFREGQTNTFHPGWEHQTIILFLRCHYSNETLKHEREIIHGSLPNLVPQLPSRLQRNKETGK